MMQVRVLAILASIALFSAGGTSAQSIRTAISTDSVRVGERFFATVALDVEAGYSTVFPDLNGGPFTAGDIVFVRPTEISTAVDHTVAHTDSAVYEVSAFGVDSAFVGGLPVGVVSPFGDTLVVMAPTVLVGIFSTVPEDAAGLKDLAPLATFPPLLWPWMLGGLALLLAIALAYYLWRRSSGQSMGVSDQHAVRLDPYDEAVRRLRDLSEQHPESDGEVRAYYIELSDTLRSYLEYTINVPALERTSSELMLALRRLSAVSIDLIGDDTLDQINRSLDVSDLAKFASYRPETNENMEVLDLTRSSIESIERARRRRMVEAESATDENV